MTISGVHCYKSNRTVGEGSLPSAARARRAAGRRAAERILRLLPRSKVEVMAVCEELGIAFAPRSPVGNDFHRHMKLNSTWPPTGAARCRVYPLGDADDRTLGRPSDRCAKPARGTARRPHERRSPGCYWRPAICAHAPMHQRLIDAALMTA